MMDFFQRLTNFVIRIYDVVKNLLHQLANLYTNPNLKKINFDSTDVHFLQSFESLADALSILVHLDEIIESNETLKNHWQFYKRLDLYKLFTKFTNSIL